MPAFRHVEANRAGPAALGFLVPPGSRTMVIIRPRALPWDLLPIRFDCGPNSGVCTFAREQAVAIARQIQQVLENAGVEARRERRTPDVQIVANPAGDGFLVWVPALEMMWMLCRRVPGRAYEPCAFADREEAQEAINLLTPYLWPEPKAGQEYYFNTHNFTGNIRGAVHIGAVRRS